MLMVNGSSLPDPSVFNEKLRLNDNEEVLRANRQRRALQQLEEALLLLPLERKAAYLEALRRCPHLVESESRPFQFLVFENYNYWSAADRLAKYWEKRYKAFGERAFLPLTLSGEGAFDADDIRLLKTGFLTIPGKSKNSYIVDRNFLHGVEYTWQMELRAFFYMLQSFLLLHGDESLESNERYYIDILWIFRNFDKPNQEFAAELSDFFYNGLPMKHRYTHIVTIKGINESFLLSMIQLVMQMFGTKSSQFVPYSCQSSAEAAARLFPYGVEKHHVTTDLDGLLRCAGDHAVFLQKSGLKLDSPKHMEGVCGMDEQEALEAWKEFVKSEGGGGSHASSDGYDVLDDPMFADILPFDDMDQGFSPEIFQTTEAASRNVITSMEPVTTRSLETKSNIKRGIRAIEDVIGMLPLSEKASYLEVRSRFPQLIGQESSPVSFLRYLKFDAWSAAKRFVSYWKNRHIAFQDKAFLPLTPNGALEGECIKLIRNGTTYLLPNDSKGRPIVCVDWSRFCGASQKLRLQLMFFLESNVVHSKVRDGMTVLILVRSGGGGLTSTLAAQLTGSSRQFGAVVRDSMRLPPATFHVICPSDEVGFIRSWVLPLALQAYGCQSSERDLFVVHDSDADRSEMLATFASHGIGKHCLPEDIGGDFRLGGKEKVPEASPVVSLPAMSMPPAKSRNSAAAAVSPSPSMERNIESPPNIALIDENHVHELDKVVYNFPQDLRAAYQEAMARAPGLVKKESDPTLFLHFRDQNVSDAAEMFLRYWQLRKKLFGSRALLPLNQTCEGALERKDVNVLQTGFLYNLPCLAADGSSVLFCDGSNLQKLNQNSLLRCVFYMWSVMAENETSQQNGFRLLYMVSDPKFDAAFQKCLDRILGCVPARVKSVHFLGLAGTDDQVRKATELLDMGSESIHQHCGQNRNDLAKALLEFGFQKQDLPVSLSGEWGYTDFVKWQELRVRHEWGLFIRTEEERRARQYHIPPCAITADETEEDRVERKRRMMIVHSRNKRERQRMAVEDLREQAMQLEDQQNKLSQDNKELTVLLHQAQSIVACNT